MASAVGDIDGANSADPVKQNAQDTNGDDTLRLDTSTSSLIKNNNAGFNQLDQSKVEYRQVHTQEREWIENHAAQFASIQCNKGDCISQEEAENRLTQQAFNRVQYGTEGWDAEANEFLR
jgi:hypothetical protein